MKPTTSTLPYVPFSRIIRESPGYRTNLPVSRTGNQISGIKATLNLCTTVQADEGGGGGLGFRVVQSLKILSRDVVGHFIVHCLATWPLRGSGSRVHFVMTRVSLICLLYLKAQATSNMQIVNVK